MPATENDRRNLQVPTLSNPSLPDHDRRQDEGMHQALPDTRSIQTMLDNEGLEVETQEDDAIAPPDQEFTRLLKSGHASNRGRIPDDPNNWLTSDPDTGYSEGDPESRGESLPDIADGDRH